MKGSTRKRGSTWSYYFDVGMVGGKRRKREKGGFRTKKEAQEALNSALNEFYNSGTIFEPSKITVSEYFDKWYDEYCLVNLKLNTLMHYRGNIETHIKPALGNIALRDLTASVIQDFINSLKSQGYSKSTVTLVRNIISGALSYAVSPLEYIRLNPCSQVHLPKFEEEKTEKRFVITPLTFALIMEKFPPGSVYHLPLMIGYYTGLRINETFALTWDDIDLAQRRISVNKTIVRMGKNRYFNAPKSASSKRLVTFGDTLYSALCDAKSRKELNKIVFGKSYRSLYAREIVTDDGLTLVRLVQGGGGKSVDMLTVDADGSYVSADNMQYAIKKKINGEMGLKFNYHSLRHTHATYLIENGAGVKDVQERLGHANSSITMNVYVHDTDEKRRETADIFEKAVSAHALAQKSVDI